MNTNSVIILDRRHCVKGHRHMRQRTVPRTCKQSLNESYSIPQRVMYYNEKDYGVLRDQERYLYLDFKNANKFFKAKKVGFTVECFHYSCLPKPRIIPDCCPILDLFLSESVYFVKFKSATHVANSDSELDSDDELDLTEGSDSVFEDSDCYSGSE